MDEDRPCCCVQFAFRGCSLISSFGGFIVFFHTPLKSVNYVSEGTVPTFAYKLALQLDPRDSLNLLF